MLSMFRMSLLAVVMILSPSLYASESWNKAQLNILLNEAYKDFKASKSEKEIVPVSIQEKTLPEVIILITSMIRRRDFHAFLCTSKAWNQFLLQELPTIFKVTLPSWSRDTQFINSFQGITERHTENGLKESGLIPNDEAMERLYIAKAFEDLGKQTPFQDIEKFQMNLSPYFFQADTVFFETLVTYLSQMTNLHKLHISLTNADENVAWMELLKSLFQSLPYLDTCTGSIT